MCALIINMMGQYKKQTEQGIMGLSQCPIMPCVFGVSIEKNMMGQYKKPTELGIMGLGTVPFCHVLSFKGKLN